MEPLRMGDEKKGYFVDNAIPTDVIKDLSDEFSLNEEISYDFLFKGDKSKDFYLGMLSAIRMVAIFEDLIKSLYIYKKAIGIYMHEFAIKTSYIIMKTE